MSVVLADAEAEAAIRIFTGFIRERAVAGRATPIEVRKLCAAIDQRLTVSQRRQSEALRRLEFGVSRIGTARAAELLGRGTRWVQRHAADLDGVMVADRLVFDERTVRDYATQALRRKEIQE